MLPDFNRLKVFYHIFNEGSSTAAASILHITQSGVSQHLKKLEDELQTPLFSRVNRRLVPTAAGHKLYEIVQGFMLELEDGVRQINATTERPSGIVRIGAPFEFGKTYMPKIFASFRRRYPEVSLQLHLGDPNALFTKVSAGELDFAYIDLLPIFLETPGGMTTYEMEPLVKEEFVLACSRNYYEKIVAGTGYEDLIKLDFIGYKKDIALFRSWFSLQYGKTPASLNMAMIVDDAGAIISGMEEGMGLGVIVSHLIREQIADGSMVAIRPTTERLENSIACVRFKEKVGTLTESCFQDHFREEMRHVSDVVLSWKSDPENITEDVLWR